MKDKAGKKAQSEVESTMKVTEGDVFRIMPAEPRRHRGEDVGPLSCAYGV